MLWAPETLHPLLKDGGTVEIVDVEGPPVELVTREGDKIPNNSYVESLLARLRPELDGDSAGWALVAKAPGRPEQRIMTVEPKPDVQRTTLSQLRPGRCRAGAGRGGGLRDRRDPAQPPARCSRWPTG